VARKREVEVRREDGIAVCDACLVADTVFTRMRGLLGRKTLEPGAGLLLRPAPSVHTLFMRFPIDVVFLDRDGRVLKVVPELRPWRAAGCRGARQVLELAAGEAARRGLATGDRLVWDAAAPNV
jgi:uncharacterized membrane protein (UPF0127 family)